MNTKTPLDRLSNHSHRLVILVSLLLIVVVALRRRYDLAANFSFELLMILLGIFSLLFISEPWLSRRITWYYRAYFVLQIIIVEILGIFQEYQDTWSLLYIILGFQVATRCARKEAFIWYSLFAAALLATLSVEFGLVSGPGRAMAYVIIGVLVISYDVQYAQHEDSLAESQILVSELQEANQKLVEHAALAEKLSALQERNRMIQELYDSVGQKVFAIQLAAETTRLMLEKDPRKAEEQIKDLQLQTQATLSQMRQLIDEWHPA